MDNLIKSLIPNKAAFGRHETFSLRYGWLTKGFQAFQKKPGIFNSDSATVELGVGKNMVNAIRYWLRTTQILETTPDGLQPTPLGEAIFADDGWDPYLEDEATLWLIHWLIASNAESATAWFWFFNCFHKTEFTPEEAANALVDFVNQQLTGKHSEKTVRNEIALILRMYCAPKITAKTDLEDILDVPLTTLQLIQSSTTPQHYLLKPERRETLPTGIFAFAVNEVFNHRQVTTLPIADLMYGESYGVAIGGIFRLTEADLIAQCERLVKRYPQIFSINETAGINQLFRHTDTHDSLSFLQHHYETLDQVNA